MFRLNKAKVKKTILKGARGKKHIIHRRTKMRLRVDFSTETKQARGECSDMFIVLKRKTISTEFHI